MEIGPNQRKWIEALRSGKYQQGRFMLHSANHRFCCLGVACDLFAKEREIDFILDDRLAPGRVPCYAYTNTKNAPSTVALPADVADMLSMDPRGWPVGDGFQQQLRFLNDICQWTFHEIADHIEQNAADYFREPV